ncbi:hypothetical protein M885DRAFT_3110 [Pelagophyceae sp. CCMP2097]|nr:hypothetical protein M885DRAFT_3110 [Pelagophyceae sp. CCMP2097]
MSPTRRWDTVRRRRFNTGLYGPRTRAFFQRTPYKGLFPTGPKTVRKLQHETENEPEYGPSKNSGLSTGLARRFERDSTVLYGLDPTAAPAWALVEPPGLDPGLCAPLWDPKTLTTSKTGVSKVRCGPQHDPEAVRSSTVLRIRGMRAVPKEPSTFDRLKKEAAQGPNGRRRGAEWASEKSDGVRIRRRAIGAESLRSVDARSRAFQRTHKGLSTYPQGPRSPLGPSPLGGLRPKGAAAVRQRRRRAAELWRGPRESHRQRALPHGRLHVVRAGRRRKVPVHPRARGRRRRRGGGAGRFFAENRRLRRAVKSRVPEFNSALEKDLCRALHALQKAPFSNGPVLKRLLFKRPLQDRPNKAGTRGGDSRRSRSLARHFREDGPLHPGRNFSVENGPSLLRCLAVNREGSQSRSEGPLSSQGPLLAAPQSGQKSRMSNALFVRPLFQRPTSRPGWRPLETATCSTAKSSTAKSSTAKSSTAKRSTAAPTRPLRRRAPTAPKRRPTLETGPVRDGPRLTGRGLQFPFVAGSAGPKTDPQIPRGPCPARVWKRGGDCWPRRCSGPSQRDRRHWVA